MGTRTQLDDKELLSYLLEQEFTSKPTHKGKLPKINWDILGIVTLGLTLIGASALYIAGWSYEAAWYGYYSLELSSLELPLYQTMIEGFPFALVLAIAIVIAFNSTKDNGCANKDNDKQLLEFSSRLALITAILLVSLLVGCIILRAPISRLTVISCVPALAVVLLSTFMGALNLFNNLLQELRKTRKGKQRFLIDAGAPKYRWHNNKKKQVNYSEPIITNAIAYLLIALLNYTIWASLAGSIDGPSAAKPLSGGWRAQPTSIYSQDEIKALTNYSFANKSADDFVYGPFYLIAQSSNKLLDITGNKHSTR
jgi:uncharacterized Tic20 family protein